MTRTQKTMLIVRLARLRLSSIYGGSGQQAKNMAELQDGIRKPGEFAKMQSPGEVRLMKFSGAAAPVLGGFGVATPTRLTREATE